MPAPQVLVEGVELGHRAFLLQVLDDGAGGRGGARGGNHVVAESREVERKRRVFAVVRVEQQGHAGAPGQQVAHQPQLETVGVQDVRLPAPEQIAKIQKGSQISAKTEPRVEVQVQQVVGTGRKIVVVLVAETTCQADGYATGAKELHPGPQKAVRDCVRRRQMKHTKGCVHPAGVRVGTRASSKMNTLLRQRILLGLAILLMMVPTFLFVAGPLRRPPMFEGDRLVELDCSVCRGVNPECETCAGKGKSTFVIPGPNRPIYLVGTVTDRASGASLAGASVKVSTEAGPIELKTSEEGQFGLRLPPGTYPLRIQDEKHPVLDETLEVAPNQQPIPVSGDLSLHRVDLSFKL